MHFVFSPPAQAAAGLLDLPWHEPLEEWQDDRLTEIPQRGISRHVVRFVAEDGDLSQPSQRAATQNTVGRAWQHGRFWVNDADCLIAGTHVERREDWAAVVERYSGLRVSSDRLRTLDAWGLETTRRLLRPGLTTPFVP